MMARSMSPRASGEVSMWATDSPPADSPKIVTLDRNRPRRLAMLSRTQSERRDLIEGPVIAGDAVLPTLHSGRDGRSIRSDPDGN